MPVPTPDFVINTFPRAQLVPSNVLDALMAQERDANCILPQLLKTRELEAKGDAYPVKQVWITCSSHSTRGTIVDLVLACAENYTAKKGYPIFINGVNRTILLSNESLITRLRALAKALREAMPISRVYSVFGPELITMPFVDIWTGLTGVYSYSDEPYYAAMQTYCTKNTIGPQRRASVHPELTFDISPADEGDIMAVAALCHGFAEDSDPFILTPEEAIQEAKSLVRNEQVWVHRISRPAQPEHHEIASIVAFTRNSRNNATITKVYTNPKWRRLGCAERLVRAVCKHLLASKDSITLYVAHNNPGAAMVYHRCGFLGLGPNAEPVEGVDRWIEIGFDRQKVQLGHW
ncbi:hypothetical protein BDQ12DRAFT_46181 [Crucibulum laeve]|uniref:N-acetyltransferase domain-containing protein n=1 Tax=Crucibulum laeve TaxID=68775 RepID=A0A5C3MHX5_9AGAR|nr:hypothetical protein BDQ12DRAFT_46181 [Crucibulum laeve]